MTATDSILRLILGTDDVMAWRPRRNMERSDTVGAWVLALASSDLPLARDLACVVMADWSFAGHVRETLDRDLALMGLAASVYRWRSILRGDIRPTAAEAKALEAWTGEPTDMGDWD